VRLVAAALLAGSLLAAAPLKTTLTAATHTPKIKTRWYYVVRAQQGGKPVAGKLTATIVDPLGGIYPVLFESTTKKLTNWPFNGRFRDYIIWPASARGIPLKLRVVVKAVGSKSTITFVVTPRG
jgi:hypothetical protein